jgi:hypothetical protein
MKNLQNSFIADAENVHHVLDDMYPLRFLLPVGVLLSGYMLLNFS